MQKRKPKSRVFRRKPMSEETKEKIRQANMGHIGYLLGKHHSEETKKLMSRVHKGHKATPGAFQKGHKTNIGRIVSQETKNKISKGLKGNPALSVNKGKKMSLETKLKLSLSKRGKPNLKLRGENNPSWKGGITPINVAIRGSMEYGIWRRGVFERDNYTCIWCGIRSVKGIKVVLHADHIKPFALYPELRFALDNGRTLCKDCHRTTDTYGNKTNKCLSDLEKIY